MQYDNSRVGVLDHLSIYAQSNNIGKGCRSGKPAADGSAVLLAAILTRLRRLERAKWLPNRPNRDVRAAGLCGEEAQIDWYEASPKWGRTPERLGVRHALDGQWRSLSPGLIKEQRGHIGYLEALLAMESEERDRHAVQKRIHDAKFPRLKTLGLASDWNFGV